MKKGMLWILVGVLVLLFSVTAYGADQSLNTTVNANVRPVFSLVFYNDANVLYNTNIPFSDVDPTNVSNLPDNRSQGDGKSDIGLLVTTNLGETWGLKIQMNQQSVLKNKIYYKVDRTRGATGGVATGTVDSLTIWKAIPTTATLFYTSGHFDEINTPSGTLVTTSYKIDGTEMQAGNKTATITYTLTTHL